MTSLLETYKPSRMKLTFAQQRKFIELAEGEALRHHYPSLAEAKANFLKLVESGDIEIIKCPARRFFGDLCTRKLLKFVCSMYREGCNDDHFATLEKRIYDMI